MFKRNETKELLKAFLQWLLAMEREKAFSSFYCFQSYELPDK